MNFLKKYPSIIIISILLIVIFFLRECNGNRNTTNVPGQVVKIDTVFTSDTIVQIYRDTVWQEKIVYLPSKPVPEPIIEDVNDSTLLTYTDSTKTDDLTLYYTAKVYGELYDIKHKYLLNIPKEITEYKEKIITNESTITITKYKTGFYVGGGVSYAVQENRPSFLIGAALTTKKNSLYSYDYDILNNSHQFSFKYKLSFRKKDKKNN